ncbi:MAG: hypothetical protein ONB11_04845 [candidate division KSB1 bacterium]|nr:hypothetical protein [candidate division KSB1 bacterium]MDZ7340081.1 hypothetical protein [candidate division KSB1 bacterium]
MGKATLAIDGHVHLYSVYDLPTAVDCGVRNLRTEASKINPEVIPVWLLVERSDANFFEKIYHNPGQFSSNGIRFKKGPDDVTITVERDSRVLLYIFAGRQLVTREGLEVLSLISNLDIPDKQKSIDQIIHAVQESGGIPALNWAPGKWFFKRGQVIARQIQQRSVTEIFIGETTLRHRLWPEPKLVKQARRKGFPIIAGSDPLPFKGEENGIGSFGFLISGAFDSAQPAQSLRAMMQRNQQDIQIIGKRNDVLTFARRQFKIMMEKRTRE